MTIDEVKEIVKSYNFQLKDGLFTTVFVCFNDSDIWDYEQCKHPNALLYIEPDEIGIYKNLSITENNKLVITDGKSYILNTYTTKLLINHIEKTILKFKTLRCKLQLEKIKEDF